jgi:hypothetical protein
MSLTKKTLILPKRTLLPRQIHLDEKQTIRLPGFNILTNLV